MFCTDFSLICVYFPPDSYEIAVLLEKAILWFEGLFCEVLNVCKKQGINWWTGIMLWLEKAVKLHFFPTSIILTLSPTFQFFSPLHTVTALKLIP